MSPDLDGSAEQPSATDSEAGEAPDTATGAEDGDPGHEAADAEPRATDGEAADDAQPDVRPGAQPDAQPDGPADEPASAASPEAASGSETDSAAEAEPAADAGLITAAGASAAPAEPPPAPVPLLARVRALTILALGPIVTGYVALAALLALVTGIASNARFTSAGVLNAALPSWLAAHQVPIEIFGLELGMLPLLPTVGVAVITAKAAARAAERLELRRPGQAGFVVGTVAGAHAMAGLIAAGLSSGAEVAVDPLAALYYPALVSALAATAGVARRCGLLDALTQRADTVAVAGLRAGALAVFLLLTAGGAMLTFGLLTSVSTARDLFPMGVGNAVGMLLLSIGYLPNATIAATSFVAGPGFSLGSVTVAPLEFHGGPLPGVPLLAALPEHQAAWWPALFVLPLAVGIVVGRRLRHVDDDPIARLRAVAVAAGVVAVSFVVLAGTAGGRLGRGTFDPVSMQAAALSIVLVLWTAVPGAVAAWFGGPRPAAEPLPGLIDDEPEPEPELYEEPEEEADEDEQPAELPGPRDSVEESGEVARDSGH